MGGGGLALYVSNSTDFSPVLVFQGNVEVELIVVEVGIETMPVRIFCRYGPQEGSPNVKAFFSRLEEEAEKSKILGCGILMDFDFNSKLSEELIPGDKHEISKRNH